MTLPPAAPRYRHVARAGAIAIAVWLIAVSWSLSIGRYGGPDEPAHVVRAAAVGRGELGGDTVPSMASGFRVVEVPATLATGTPSCYRHDARIPATCAAGHRATGTVRAATAAGINPPTYYVAIGVPVHWLGDSADTTWYRVVAASWTAAWILVAAFASRPLRSSQRLAFALIVPPAAWFLGGVVNPSAWEVAACALAWIGVARVAARPGAVAVADAGWIGVGAAIAISVRSVAVLWVATMAVVLAILTLRRVRWTRCAAAAALGPIALAVACVLVWNRWIGLELHDDRTATADGLLTRVRTSLAGTRETLHEMVGTLGWSEYSAPGVVQALWWAGAATLLVLAWRRGRRHRAALVAWGAGVLLGPVAFEVATARDVGYIWQGRYSIGVTIGLAAMLGAGGRSDADTSASPAPRGRRRTQVVAVPVALLTVAEVATFWSVLRRATVGSAGSWWPSTPAGSWSPPVDARVLLLGHVVVAITAAIAITRATSRARRRADQVM